MNTLFTIHNWKFGDIVGSKFINKSQNKCVDAEKSAGSRVLLAQHPRPSVFPVTTDVLANEELRIEELNTTGQ
jgi:hypothetical protein